MMAPTELYLKIEKKYTCVQLHFFNMTGHCPALIERWFFKFSHTLSYSPGTFGVAVNCQGPF